MKFYKNSNKFVPSNSRFLGVSGITGRWCWINVDNGIYISADFYPFNGYCNISKKVLNKRELLNIKDFLRYENR